MAKVWLWSFIVQKAKVREDWGFNLFQMLKQCMAGVVYSGKSSNKVRLRYGKNKDKVRLGIYSIGNVKIRYCWGFLPLKILG